MSNGSHVGRRWLRGHLKSRFSDGEELARTTGDDDTPPMRPPPPEASDGRDVGRVVAKASRGFCAQQSSCPDLQSFDPKRDDGLRTEQDAGEHLGIDEAGGRADRGGIQTGTDTRPDLVEHPHPSGC